MNKEDIVNGYFRNGLPYLLGFNPWEIQGIINTIEDHPLYRLFIDPEHLEDLKVWSLNWTRLLNEYFTWQPERFPDPVEQCYYIANSSERMCDILFDGLDVENKQLEIPFFNLYYSTAKYLDRVADEIMGWALTHQFKGEVFSDVFEE